MQILREGTLKKFGIWRILDLKELSSSSGLFSQHLTDEFITQIF